MRLIDALRVSKHLISQVARARQETPRLDLPAFLTTETGLIFRSERGGPVRPFTCWAKGETRRRNEVANGPENQTVGTSFLRRVSPFAQQVDRKSTRLNSSHQIISYSV